MELTIKQTIALDYLEDNETTEVLFGGGAGGAKSVLGCYWILKCSLKYPGTRWVIGRAVLKTLKETTLNTFWWVCAQQEIIPGKHFTYNENKGLIKFYNGSEILLKDLFCYPSDQNFDELGSLEITGAFIDECNQVIQKAWLVLKSRIRYKLDEYGLIPKQLGSCNPAKNWVYNRFYQPSVKKQLPVTRKFVQSLLADNPHISKHYRDNLLDLDQNSKERLLYGNWDYDSDPAVLCQFDAIADLFTNDHVSGTGQKYASADLAMQGRDKFIAGTWDGLVLDLSKGVDKGKATGKEIEDDLKRIMVANGIPRSHTVADSDGLGAYLESYLTGIKEFHGGATANDKKEYANLKSECAYKLAELINKREIKIICSEEQKTAITEELGVLKSKDADADETRKRIIDKKTMKELLGRSPDYLDMMIMRMFFEVKRKDYHLIYE